MSDRTFEIDCGNKFVGWYNKQYSLNCRYQAEKELDSEVDGHIISSEADIYVAKIQIVTRNGLTHKGFASLRKKAKETSENIVFGSVADFGSVRKISDAIKLKEENRYPTRLMNELVLLVGAEFGPLIDEEYLKKELADIQSSLYRAIYYVRIPSPESSHKKDGQVIELKPLQL